MRRRSLLVLLLLLFVPAAGAWTWPVQGPVLQTFSFDRAHPYDGGQHRGVAIGAGEGAAVLAPTSGVVTFASTVPTSGKTITIETPSGLAVSLTHLGSIGVARNASVDEGATVGTVGSSGTPEFDVPYVHLGVREAANDQGYLDPLAFLPVVAPPAAAPAPAPPVAAPAPAPIVAAPRPVEAPAVPVAAPVAPPVVPSVPVAAPSAPAVESPAPAPSVPVEPSLPEVPAVPAPALSPAPVATGSPHALPMASPVASPAAGPVSGSSEPAAVAPPASATVATAAHSRSVAGTSPAVSPLLGALRIQGLRQSPASSLVPRPLPAARPLSSAEGLPPSSGSVRVLWLVLAASLLVAASVAFVWLRRRRPPAPPVRLRVVASASRGRLAA